MNTFSRAALLVLAGLAAGCPYEQEVQTWRIEREDSAPGLLLGGGDSVEVSVAVTANAEAVPVDNALIPSIGTHVSACLLGGNEPATMHLVLLPTVERRGTGRARKALVPACPATAELPFHEIPINVYCLGTQPCTGTASLTLTRTDPGPGEITLDWTATSAIVGYGKTPPAGAGIESVDFSPPP